MSTINYHKREIVTKIVYYGPGLCGKTTSLEFIHRTAKGVRGELISLSTDEDRTLYFDYLPVELPRLGGFTVRVQLYTVPGQVYYNATRKLVLEAADGVVFVADSQRARGNANLESLDNLVENLREKRMSLKGMPEIVATGGKKSAPPAPSNGSPPLEEISWIIQYNKRDLPDALPLDVLEEQLNVAAVPAFDTVAIEGKGILESLQSICMLVLADVRDRGRLREGSLPEPSKAIAKVASKASTKEGSLTATSLADITDVVSTLAEQDGHVEETLNEDTATTGAKNLVAIELEEDPTTLPGANEFLAAPTHKFERTEKATSPNLPVVNVPLGLDAVTSNASVALSMLSRLPQQNVYREALITLEGHLRAGKWHATVTAAGTAFRDFAETLARSCAAPATSDTLWFAAAWVGLSAARTARFIELVRTAETVDTPSTADQALFAFFCLTDFILRLEEIKSK